VTDEGARDPVAVKVAENDATFRNANERIHDTAEALGMDEEAGLLPFLCECADVHCTTLVQLSLSEYEAVRASSVLFVNARGHEVNALGWGRVVDEFDRYTVVEKIGDAAEVVAELDQATESRRE
jgi:hypothetical protein